MRSWLWCTLALDVMALDEAPHWLPWLPELCTPEWSPENLLGDPVPAPVRSDGRVLVAISLQGSTCQQRG